MRRTRWWLIGMVLGCSGAGGSGATPDVGGAPDAGGADVATTPPRDADVAAGLRDQRYCEVLAGAIAGAVVQLDVYNTIGLNACPDEAWRALDVPTLRTQLGAQVVILNGPRRWLLDAFEVAALQNATVREIGGIPMRVAGRIEVPLSVAASGGTAYRGQTVRRDTTVRFDAGARVYELIDDANAVYVMQSYSLQMQPQTLASLETLGERLRLPMGWRFRTRVLTEALRVTAVGGLATVVPDELGNAYQRTQLMP